MTVRTDLKRLRETLDESDPPTRWEVWRQAANGANAFSCEGYPEPLTREQLDDHVPPAGVGVIRVAYVAAEDDW